jgi:hypothetical protein
MADKPSNVTATCPVCGMSRFQSSSETPADTDVLTCESCGLKLSYAFLLRRMEQAPAAPEEMPASLEEASAAPNRAPVKARKRKKARKKPALKGADA